MKASHRALLLAALLLPVLLACTAPPASGQHSRGAHESQATTPGPAAIPAHRYATDAALREGMSRIHAALDDLAHYEMGHMPQSIAVERVATIKQATSYLFANCKLDPEADAALHRMLVPLLNGVQAFEKNPADTSTVAAMRRAAADYPRVFDDPNWSVKADAGNKQSR